MNRGYTSALLVIFLLAASQFAFARSIVPFLSAGHMLDASEVVVVGTISGQYEVQDGNTTFFGYELTVTEAIKGGEQSNVMQLMMGYETIDDAGNVYRYSEDYSLEEEKAYVVFAQTGRQGFVSLTGALGIYIQELGPGSSPYFVPIQSGGELMLAHPSGQAVQSRRIYGEKAFKNALRARISDANIIVESSAANLELTDFPILMAMADPAHCNPITSTFSGSRPLRSVRWPSPNITIFHNARNPAVGSTNAHALVVAMIASLNSEYAGLSLSYGGITPIASPECLSQAYSAGSGASITISFLAPGNTCNDTGLTGCSGTLGRGGPSYSSAVNTSSNGDQYYSIVSGGVGIDPGSACVGESGYIRLLEHEVTHALGFDHISPASGAANMNPNCCINISALDRACLDYTYAPSAFPVELTKFVANSQEYSVDLEWATASEQDNAYFEIERSHDGETYQPIGRIAGQIESRELLEYQHIDRSPLAGTSYYRLVQHDLDGMYSTSDVVAVQRNAYDRLQLIPNPVINGSELLLQGLEEDTEQIVIFDVAGREVFAASAKPAGGQFTIQLPASLAAGMYYVQIMGGSALKTEVLNIR